MVTSHMVEQVGRVVGGRYRLVAPLGSGASSQVYLADDVRLRRRVAIKMLHPALIDDRAFLRRFQAEAQAAGALSHPHINAVFDWGDDLHTPYLVLDYLSGGSLRALLDAGHRLDLAQAARIGHETADALAFAHARGFVHRDVKPGNLLFDGDGRLRVADFGLARALAEAAWTEPDGAVVGTARYAAPEQARGDAVDGRGDVYALGLVLIEAVTGEVPFSADTTIATLMARVERPVAVPEEMGPLRDLLASMGAVDPADRPDAAEVKRVIEGIRRRLGPAHSLPLAGAAPRSADALAAPADPTMIPGVPSDQTPVPDPVVVSDDGDEPAGRWARWRERRRERRVTRRANRTASGSRRRRWLLAVTLAVAAALGVGGTMLIQEVTVPEHEVPRLLGMTQGDARAEALEMGFQVQVTRIHADDTSSGDVLSQEPDPGSVLREGETVRLVVSLGPEPVPVPEIDGLPLDEATEALQGVGLEPGEITRRYDEEIPKDAVIEATSGAEVPRGQGVDLIVSDGPEPREVPDLAGMTFAEAEAELAALELEAQQVEEFSDDVEAGLVINTVPPVGAEAARDSTVDVVVSKGPEIITVPNVAGRTTSDAAEVLESAGLEVRGVEGNPNNPVKGTDPAAGTEVRRGTRITIRT